MSVGGYDDKDGLLYSGALFESRAGHLLMWLRWIVTMHITCQQRRDIALNRPQPLNSSILPVHISYYRPEMHNLK